MQDSLAKPLGERSGSHAAGSRAASKGRTKFIVGGVLILAAVVYLIISSTQAAAQYYLTLKELQARQSELVGKSVSVSGVVLGDTIQQDPKTATLTFTVANIPGTTEEIDAMGGLAEALHKMAVDPGQPRMKVIYVGQRPDLLKNEAQAIMTGKLAADGTFHADSLLLKCPTKYSDAMPTPVGGQ
jgi:cytochrome c-type biogenesis protein CcmE